MKLVKTSRLFGPLVAISLILFPATYLFADSGKHKKAYMVSILDLSAPPSLPRPEIVDADGNAIVWSFVPDTSKALVYNQDPFFLADEGVVPILDPKGNHVNLRDWMRARGRLTAKCVPGGTQYKFRLAGLIPNGVYTVWHFPDTGGGALATTSFDEVDNVFKASKHGRANFDVLAEPGPMTFGGSMPACSLTGSAQELFVVLYHIDNEYCGPFPCNGPGKKSVEAAHIFFKR